LPESTGIKRGRELLHRLVIGVISGWRRKTMTWPSSRAHTSARERGIECTSSGFGVLGRGLKFGRARMVPQGLFPIFFCFLPFLFSIFLISFMDFANLLQIASN
jgi:hypothetical protein